MLPTPWLWNMIIIFSYEKLQLYFIVTHISPPSSSQITQYICIWPDHRYRLTYQYAWLLYPGCISIKYVLTWKYKIFWQFPVPVLGRVSCWCITCIHVSMVTTNCRLTLYLVLVHHHQLWRLSVTTSLNLKMRMCWLLPAAAVPWSTVVCSAADWRYRDSPPADVSSLLTVSRCRHAVPTRPVGRTPQSTGR